MIICKTPFRISFFGGGTDYPVWYRKYGGAVLSTTIDKFCYITCRYLPPFFDHKYHIVYSKDEKVNKISEIDHPAVRETFRFMKINKGLEIHYDADLPAKSGLGSSSSFTVGLLHILNALRGRMVSSQDLALDAIHIEQEILRENVGSQDQIAAAYGGFNRISFNRDSSISVVPMIINPSKIKELQKHLLFFFTGFSRIASNIAGQQIKNTPNKKNELSTMYNFVDEAAAILKSGKNDIEEFGKLLHQSWLLKRSLTNKISNPKIDEIYDMALKAGALGGKLTGAGGGGFMLLFARPENHKRIKEKLKEFLFVPVQFEKSGSKIIVYNGQ